MHIRSLAAVLVAATLTAAPIPTGSPVHRGVQFLIRTQGPDGGWGQDGGATSHVRQGERLETNSNDVANTASALLALTHAGENGPQIRRGVEFLLKEIEQSPEEALPSRRSRARRFSANLGRISTRF